MCGKAAGLQSSCTAATQVKKVEVQRYYRPEDISQDQAYKAGLWDVYASDEKEMIELSSIIGRCQVAGNGAAAPAQAGIDLPADPLPTGTSGSAITCLTPSRM